MAYTYLPITGSSSGLDWDTLIELWFAAREREQVFLNPPYCCNNWPRRKTELTDGTISSITATTITDSGAAWTTNQWAGKQVIIDDCDPKKIVRATISSNTSTVLTVADMTDYVTGNWISSIGSLSGKNYFIILSGEPWYAGHMSYDRMPDFPNDNALYVGTCTGGSLASPSLSYIEDLNANFPDSLDAKYLFVYASGILRKVQIDSVTSTRLYFASQAWTASGAYSVMPLSTSKCTPGKLGANLWKWYSGALTTASGLTYDDNISSSNFAAATISVEFGVPPCESDDVTAKDVDVVTAADDECNPDDFYTLQYWKSLRSLQVWAVGRCTSFCEDKDWEGPSAIKNWTVAEWFNKFISGNSGTSTVAGSEPNYYFSITRPYVGASAWWTILNDDGSTYLTGYSSIESTNKIILPDIAPEDVGKDVVWSYGYTRKIHKQFRRLWDKTCFIPSLDGVSVVDPPTCDTFPGTWIKEPASTVYAEVDDDGYVNDDGPAFSNGDYARFVGHNFNDGDVGGMATGSGAEMEYYAHFAEKNHVKSVQNQIRSQKKGTITDGGTTWLQDDSKHWWDPKWYTGGIMKTHSGTATGGSNTSLITATGTLSDSCFFDATRFVGMDPFENFVLEFDKTVGTSTTTYQVRITSVSGDTFNIESIGVAPANGDAWRLKEPYESNRYEGRTITITEDDGTTTHTATITANSDDTLFFTTTTAVQPGWTYEITDPPVAAVYHRVAGAWVPETTQKEPDHVTRYGYQRKLDIVNPLLINQIKDGIDEMTATMVSANSWTADGDCNQWHSAVNLSDFLSHDTWAGAYGQAETNWTGTGDVRDSGCSEEDGLAPYASYEGSFWWDLDWESNNYTAGISRAFSYAQISGINTCLDHAVDFYAYAGINSANDDASASGTAIRVFDDNGDGLVYREWVNWSSIASSNSTSHISDALGNTDPSTQPNRCTEPTNDHDYNSVHDATTSTRGYYVLDAKAVLRWDMTYV